MATRQFNRRAQGTRAARSGTVPQRMMDGCDALTAASPSRGLRLRQAKGPAPGRRLRFAASSSSTPLRLAVVRGRLDLPAAGVLFPRVAQAVTAWRAVEAHRHGIAEEVETLVIERTDALAELRKGGADIAGFNAGCRREAERAVCIRSRRAAVGHG